MNDCLIFTINFCLDLFIWEEKRKHAAIPQTPPWNTAKHVYLSCLLYSMEPEEEVWKNKKARIATDPLLFAIIDRRYEEGC